MDLYFSPLACSLATRIALYEAGAQAGFIQVDTKSKQLSDGSDFYPISPLGQVPVLRTRAWSAMSWAKLEATIAEHADGAAADTVAYLASLTAWAADIRALIGRMPARIAELSQELGSAVEAHPAKRLLFMHQRGKLDTAAVAARCATPGHTLELARVLGLS